MTLNDADDNVLMSNLDEMDSLDGDETSETSETCELHFITTITDDGISTAVSMQKAEYSETSSNLLGTSNSAKVIVETEEEDKEEDAGDKLVDIDETESTADLHFITTITDDGISTAVSVQKAEYSETSSNLLGTSNSAKVIVESGKEALVEAVEENENNFDDEDDEEELKVINPQSTEQKDLEIDVDDDKQSEYAKEADQESTLNYSSQNFNDLADFNKTGNTGNDENDDYYDDVSNDNGDEEYEEEEEDFGEEEENNVETKNINKRKGYPDRNPLKTVGNTKIGLSQAKLFGLLNKDGQVDLNFRKNKMDKGKPKPSTAKHMKEMSKPKDLTTVVQNIELPDEGLSFKPAKSKEAMAAMKNKKCGYDFLDNLDDGKDFMQRLFMAETGAGGAKPKKGLQEALEKDYEYSHDKLQCPSCKKEQSFDEYQKKKRDCSQCQQKFTKLNITNGSSFMKKNKLREQERLAKIKNIEKQMYGELGHLLPKTSTTVKATAERQGQRPYVRPKSAGGVCSKSSAIWNESSQSNNNEVGRVGNVHKILQLSQTSRQAAVNRLSRADVVLEGGDEDEDRTGPYKTMPIHPVKVAQEIARNDGETRQRISQQLLGSIMTDAQSDLASTEYTAQPPTAPSSSSRRPLSATTGNRGEVGEKRQVGVSKVGSKVRDAVPGKDGKKAKGSDKSNTVPLPRGGKGANDRDRDRNRDKDKEKKKKTRLADKQKVEDENELVAQKFAKLLEI